MDVDTSLSTPIKKIKGLSLGSPLYPSLNEFQPNNMAQEMVNRGYSQTLTNNVLEELNARANEVSQNVNLSPSNRIPTSSASRRNKRYLGIHRAKFKKMESIANHYSVKTIDADPNGNMNDVGKRNLANMNIINKKRRTSTGMEEILKLSPVKCAVPQKSSPIKETPQSSPIRRISPSKKSMNLNKLLNEGDNKRSTSLQMAGVSPAKTQSVRTIPKLTKPVPANNDNNGSPRMKSSIPKLNSTKFNSREDKENEAISKFSFSKSQKFSTLDNRRKPSTVISNKHNGELSNKLSIPSLSHKLSIPKLAHKLSISSLTHKLSIPSLNHSSLQPLTKSKSAYDDSIRLVPSQKKPVPDSNGQQPKRYTIPKPFSLYNKPTISSSQKSLNKFQRFKDKFN